MAPRVRLKMRRNRADDSAADPLKPKDSIDNDKHSASSAHDSSRFAHHAPHHRQSYYLFNMAPERTFSGRSTATTAWRQKTQQSRGAPREEEADVLDEGDDSEEDVEDDLQLNVFLAGCTGLSRNSLEKAISLVSRTPVRIHRMRSSDHRRARLHTPQCVQKLLNLEILTVRQQEVRVIEWDPITADMEPMEAQHQPRARMVDVAVRTTVTAEAMRTVIGHIRHAILDLDRSVDALEQVWIEPADVGIVPISRMRRGRWRMTEAEKGNTDSARERRTSTAEVCQPRRRSRGDQQRQEQPQLQCPR